MNKSRLKKKQESDINNIQIIKFSKKFFFLKNEN